MKKLLPVALCAVCLLGACGLTACGSGSKEATFTSATTQASTNENGAEFSIGLEAYSDNINYTEKSVDSSMKQIISMDVWTAIQQNTDSAGQAETFYAVEYDDATDVPQFAAMTYDATGLIKEARLDWSSTEAMADTETFRKYAIVQLMSLSSLDADTAGKMFDTAKAAPYTNGASTQLTYAYNKTIRCYYMINSGYNIFVVEPFSQESKTNEEATKKFVYTEVLAGGVANASGTAKTTSSSTTTSTT